MILINVLKYLHLEKQLKAWGFLKIVFTLRVLKSNMNHKFLLLLLSFTTSFLANAQTTTYYLQGNMSAFSDIKSEFKRELLRLSDNNFEVKEYHKDTLILKGNIVNVKNENIANDFLSYYRTNLGVHHPYKLSKHDFRNAIGNFTLYNKDVKEREYMFRNDKVLTFQIWNQDGSACLKNGSGSECKLENDRESVKSYILYKDSITVEAYMVRNIQKDTIYDNVDKVAEPKNSMSGFYEDLVSILKYPVVSMFLGKEGKVYISFVVNEQGKLVDFEALDRGTGRFRSFENKTIKKLQSLSSWNPAILNRKKVKTMFTLPVRYTLSD